jgi:hypothetical protein
LNGGAPNAQRASGNNNDFTFYAIHKISWVLFGSFGLSA